MTRVQSKFAIINEMWSKNMIWYELKMILKGTNLDRLDGVESEEVKAIDGKRNTTLLL